MGRVENNFRQHLLLLAGEIKQFNGASNTIVLNYFLLKPAPPNLQQSPLNLYFINNMDLLSLAHVLPETSTRLCMQKFKTDAWLLIPKVFQKIIVQTSYRNRNAIEV